ncbi:MAG TPA: response regulator [Dissulfurispiraceae bacterium]|nr:response regulator [Dissulfurispiraceae bacterium]
MKRTKVLLVDDEVEFATALAERLNLRNYDAKAVFCAEDAFAMANNNPPDVILLDMNMPGLHGFEVVDELKKFDPTVEIIILSGQGGLSDAKDVAGVFDYLVKPIDIRELMNLIDKAQLARIEQAAQNRRPHGT